MKAYHLKVLVVVVAAFMAAGCATQQAAQMPWASFQAQDLNGKLQSGAYEQKVDSFLVVMDASGTMREAYDGRMKTDITKGFVWGLDQTIPEISLTSGLRTLGQNFSSDSRLVYGMTAYSKGALGAAAAAVSGGGLTPLGLAIARAADDLQKTQGNIAPDRVERRQRDGHDECGGCGSPEVAVRRQDLHLSGPRGR